MKKSLLFIIIISMLCCLTACDTGESIGTYDYYAKKVHRVNEGIVEPIKNQDSVALCQMFSKNAIWQTDYYLDNDVEEQCMEYIKAFDDKEIVEIEEDFDFAYSGSHAHQPMYVYPMVELTLSDGEKYEMEWGGCILSDEKPDLLGLDWLMLKKGDEIIAECGSRRLHEYVEKKRNWLLETVEEAINTQNAQGLIDLIPEEYRNDGHRSKAEKCMEMFGGHKIKELPEYTLDYSGGNMDETLTIDYHGFDIRLDDGRTFTVAMKYNLRDYDPMDYGEHGTHEKYGLTFFMIMDDKDNKEFFGT